MSVIYGSIMYEQHSLLGRKFTVNVRQFVYLSVVANPGTAFLIESFESNTKRTDNKSSGLRSLYWGFVKFCEVVRNNTFRYKTS